MSSSAFLASLLSRAPQRILERMETLAQLSQGKGWGAADVSAEVASCLNLLPANARQQPILAVDVGANVGEWTAQLVKQAPMAQVLAFEPTPSASRALIQRFRDNGSVEVLSMAAGSVNGQATLVGDLDQAAHVSAISTQEPTPAQSETRMVRLDSLEKLCEAETIHILKVDTEGGEWEVLEGAGSLLAKIQVIEFEFGEDALRRNRRFRDFWELFASHGFVLWRQTPRGIKFVDSYAPRLETYACTNYFAIPART